MKDCVLSTTNHWFKVARPNPTGADFSAQMGCHLEEVVEMLDELEPQSSYAEGHLSQAITHLRALSCYMKNHHNEFVVENHIGMLDGLCDQLVTATGVAHTLDYNIIGALSEVNRSNFSKFDEHGMPIYNEQRKVMKGPNYTKPDLTSFI